MQDFSSPVYFKPRESPGEADAQLMKLQADFLNVTVPWWVCRYGIHVAC